MKVFLTHTPGELAHYYGSAPLAALRQQAEVVLNLAAHPPSTDDLIRLAVDCQVIVSARSAAIPAPAFEALPDLLAVCRVAVDIRNIDVDAASRHGVLITQATPGFDASVSEWILGTMIDLSRGISRAAAQFWQGEAPTVQMGAQLRGATIGIIGWGFIGRYLSTVAKALGMEVLVADPHAEVPETTPLRVVTQDALLSASDYVVCLAPATPETRHLIDASVLRRMRRSAFFINASRGELIDEQALLDALDQGLIAGAALDVGSAPDQMPPARLGRHPKIIATPHIGGLTPAATQHQAMDTVAQVAALVAGRWPAHAVNAAFATRLQRAGIAPAV